MSAVARVNQDGSGSYVPIQHSRPDPVEIHAIVDQVQKTESMEHWPQIW